MGDCCNFFRMQFDVDEDGNEGGDDNDHAYPAERVEMYDTG